jgi:hypothetical protein
VRFPKAIDRFEAGKWKARSAFSLNREMVGRPREAETPHQIEASATIANFAPEPQCAVDALAMCCNSGVLTSESSALISTSKPSTMLVGPEWPSPQLLAARFDAIDGWARRVRWARLFVLLFALAFSLRVAYIITAKTYLAVERPEVVMLGHTLARTHVLGNIFKVPTGPTALCPPAYPFLLSIIYTLFPNEIQGQLVQEILCAAVAALQFALLPRFAFGCGLPIAAGLFAALLGALVPAKLWLETKGSGESAYSALLLLLLSLITISWWRAKRLSFLSGAGLGLLWGFTFHFAPSFLPVLLSFLVVGGCLARTSWLRQYLRSASLVASVALIATIPWNLRNYQQLGGIVFFRSNLGLELSIAHNDAAGVAMSDNYDAPGANPLHPFNRVDEALKLKTLGELEYNRQKLTTALTWIMSHSARVTSLTARRFLYFWAPPGNTLIKTLVTALVTILAFLGWYKVYRVSPLAGSLILSIWIAYPLPYYLVHGDPRYSYVIRWTLLFTSVFGLSFLLPVLKRKLPFQLSTAAGLQIDKWPVHLQQGRW